MNLSVHDVKDKTGISVGNLSALETGKNLPSAKALISLSGLYNVTTDWILKGEIKSGEQDDPTLKEMIECLKIMWVNSDEKMKNWLEIQFQVLKKFFINSEK
jgi:transcriptional regulator with XRE-family HTH domain